ncbi:MAG: protein YgfX [Pseudomonadota bacterium]
MSIAVSVLVRPSSGLRLLHAGACCCAMVSAAACPGWCAPLCCVLVGLFGLWRGRPYRFARQLDISAVGQLRLTVYRETGTALRLLEGSTIWPGLLMLRLGDGDGNVRLVTVLPDSVTSADWRALSLACRAIAARAEIKTRTL